MTEDRGRYDVERKPKLIRESCFVPFGKGWTQPTAAEVKAMINMLGMSRQEVADYVGAGSGKTVRRWEAPEDTQGYRKIPYAVWQLLHWRLVSVVPPEQYYGLRPAFETVGRLLTGAADG